MIRPMGRLLWQCRLLPYSRGGIPIAMRSFRPFAFVLALSLAALPAVMAQNPGGSSAAQGQSQDAGQNQPQSQNPSQAPNQAGQTNPQPQTQPNQESGQMSVQARIRMRREQRRATAIHDAYDHKYDTYFNMGYLRFKPGPSDNIQRLTYYAWNFGLTRYFSERLGVNLDGRGYYGTAYVGLNKFGLTRPAISQYDVLLGPTYRFYLQPKYSISGRVMGGWAYGNFSGDLNGFPPSSFGLYSDQSTYAASAAVIGEYNVTPNVALRLAPEYFFTGFGSDVQASRGFTAGLVYRFGRQ